LHGLLHCDFFRNFLRDFLRDFLRNNAPSRAAFVIIRQLILRYHRSKRSAGGLIC